MERAPWLVLAVRLVVLALSVQTGGIARDVADVVWAVAIGADAPDVDDDCLRDRGDCHCPPGCPNCHCSHGVASLPQVAPGPLVFIPRTGAPLVRGGADDSAAPRPFLGSVYRPPRTVGMGV
jgi:hypothetical protein